MPTLLWADDVAAIDRYLDRRIWVERWLWAGPLYTEAESEDEFGHACYEWGF